jgi:hypothetical protein
MTAEKPRKIAFEGKSPGKRVMKQEKPRKIAFEGKSPGKSHDSRNFKGRD